MLVSFRRYELPARYDGTKFTSVDIQESIDGVSGWNTIETQAITQRDPANPDPISITTDNGTLVGGWYRLIFHDTNANTITSDPVQNVTSEIMASLGDINGFLDGTAVEADANNTRLIQIAVARIIRGYLAPIIDRVTLFDWDSPGTTPDLIRTIAGMLIAAQLYFNKISQQSRTITNDNYAQRLYNRAMLHLQNIVSGAEVIDGVTLISGADTTGLEDGDYFPVDDTDRAFTMSMFG